MYASILYEFIKRFKTKVEQLYLISMFYYLIYIINKCKMLTSQDIQCMLFHWFFISKVQTPATPTI